MHLDESIEQTRDAAEIIERVARRVSEVGLLWSFWPLTRTTMKTPKGVLITIEPLTVDQRIDAAEMLDMAEDLRKTHLSMLDTHGKLIVERDRRLAAAETT